MLTFAVTCTPDYKRAWVFDSLKLLAGCRCAALLHPDDRRPLPENVERIPYTADGCRHQFGGFVNALMAEADDVIVSIDADAVFQRDLLPYERWLLESLEHSIGLGYNVRPGQLGSEEFPLLKPWCTIETAAEKLNLPVSVLRSCRMYNTGFMAAKASMWKKLYTCCTSMLDSSNPGNCFGMHSWVQYAVCCTLMRYDFLVEELDYTVHSHGHHKLTPDHSRRNGKLLYKGQEVLYAHAV